MNTPENLEYAPAISADGLQLFFTRGDRSLQGTITATRILRAVRSSIAEPFGTPMPIPSINGFVEGPVLSRDGRTLYFHRKDGDRFVLARVVRD